MIPRIDDEPAHLLGTPDPRSAAVVYAHGHTTTALREALSPLGYEVRPCEEGVDELVWRTEDVQPSVAFVGRREPPEVSLALMGRLAHDATCPVVAVVPEVDAAYVQEAARRGVFGVVLVTDLAALPAVIEVARARFLQYQSLQSAFARRATVEQAKGILMAQHGIDQYAAFDILRAHARRSSSKVV